MRTQGRTFSIWETFLILVIFNFERTLLKRKYEKVVEIQRLFKHRKYQLSHIVFNIESLTINRSRKFSGLRAIKMVNQCYATYYFEIIAFDKK